jgi:hypothetical protein
LTRVDEFASVPLYFLLDFDSITESTAALPACSLLDESSSDTEKETEEPDNAESQHFAPPQEAEVKFRSDPRQIRLAE